MYERMLTLEERERFAYIEGRTGDAELLAHALEGDEEQQGRITELEKANDDLQGQYDDEYARAEKAEERAADLESELENAQDEVKELREQIHTAGVDLL